MKKNQTELDEGLRLLVKSSVFIFVTLFLSKIFIYIYRIIIARYYNPEIYGIFSLTIMVIGWFATFAGLGLPQGLLRYISLYRGKNEYKKIRFISQTSLLFLAILSIFGGVLLFFSAEFIAIRFFKSPDLILFLKLASIVIPLNVILDSMLIIILAHERAILHSFIFNIVLNFVKVASLGVLIIIGFNSNSIMFSYISGFLIAILAAFYICRIKLHIFEKYRISKKEKKDITKSLISYSWPLLFYGIVLQVFGWTDSFTIGVLRNVEDVGFYNVAIPLSQLLALTFPLFIQLFFPLVTREYSQDKKNIAVIQSLSKQVGKWIFIMNLPILVLLLLFPGVFINLFFGDEYLVAENSLRFLSIGVFFTSLFTISQNLINMVGKSRIVMIDLVFASIINILLNLVFIQKYGITGAALATMISLVFLNLLFLLQAKFYVGVVPLKKNMLKIFIIALIPTTLLFVLKDFAYINIIYLILLGILFGLLYLFLIVVTGCLDENDFMILRSIKRKVIG
jgi:O-antigen/teichoic acid export membrane protein